jgi:hypothetical protein
VRSLTVHPRDHDLVIGTHGRALWILDDIRPLRALAQNPNLTADTVHLFEAPVAYLRNTAAVDGYHFSGDAIFQGETRPPGALLTYWVGTDSAGAAELTVTDGGGTVVRTFTVPAERGLNRVAWDLREDTPAGGGQGGQGGGRFRARAPEVLPGTYMVRVSLDGSSSERPVAVLPDPRVDVPMEERREKHEAVQTSLELNTRLSDVQSAAQDVREGLDRVGEALGDREDEAAVALREAAVELRRGLAEASSTEEVNGFRRGVGSLVGSYDRPTEGQLLDLRRMGEALARLESAWNGFLAGPVASFRRQVAEANLDIFPNPGSVGG